MIECPGCQRELHDRAVACNTCGYEFPRRAAAQVRDPMRRVCANIERGQRCTDMSRFFPGTRGDGPGYCWTHANFVHGGHPETGKPRPPVAGTFEALRALTKRVAPVKPVDFEAVAERAAIQAEAADD